MDDGDSCTIRMYLTPLKNDYDGIHCYVYFTKLKNILLILIPKNFCLCELQLLLIFTILEIKNEKI